MSCLLMGTLTCECPGEPVCDQLAPPGYIANSASNWRCADGDLDRKCGKHNMSMDKQALEGKVKLKPLDGENSEF